MSEEEKISLGSPLSSPYRSELAVRWDHILSYHAQIWFDLSHVIPWRWVQCWFKFNNGHHGLGLTRALLGLWISHRLLGGGGAFERPPWSRLLVAVEKNERQRSKAREKSFRNHFGHFLAQVKIGVSRGQNSKIFQNGFSTIKSLILKIEQRIWYHRVCLVKARRTMYNLTLKGQGQNLTSGQVRARSLGDPRRSNYTSFDAPCGDKRNDSNHTSLSLNDQKLLANDGWWPRVTSNDLSRGRQCKFLRELSTNDLYDMISLKYASAKVNITELIFCPLTYNGEVAKMTWPEVTDIKNPRCTFCRHWWPHHILKGS